MFDYLLSTVLVLINNAFDSHRVIRGVSQEPLPILFVSDNNLVPSKVLPLAKSNSTAPQKLALRTMYVGSFVVV